MRIALFGGTFDPPHHGHLAVARAAQRRFALDLVLFAPAGRQPLKHDNAAPFADRLAMVTLACTDEAGLAPSALDAPRPDGSPNYTVDALAALRLAHPEAALFNLVGADAFHDLARWHQPGRLLELAEWIVVSRPGFALAEPAGMDLTPAQRARIHALDTVHEDVSATELRRLLAADEPTGRLLPPAVAGYIRQHHLYGA